MSRRSLKDMGGHTLLPECCHSFSNQGPSFSFKVQSLDVSIDRMASQARDDACCAALYIPWHQETRMPTMAEFDTHGYHVHELQSVRRNVLAGDKREHGLCWTRATLCFFLTGSSGSATSTADGTLAACDCSPAALASSSCCCA